MRQYFNATLFLRVLQTVQLVAVVDPQVVPGRTLNSVIATLVAIIIIVIILVGTFVVSQERKRKARTKRAAIF